MPSVLQIAGVAAIITGAFLIAIPAGFIIGGLLLTLMGIAMERNESAE